MVHRHLTPEVALESGPVSEFNAPATRDLFLASQERAPIPFTILRALRAASGGIVDFEWIYANPAALRTLMATHASLIGQRLLARFPGHREHPDLLARYVRTVETGEQSQVELHYTADGINGFFRNAVTPMGTDLIGVWFEEITERKAAENILRLSATELRHRIKNLMSVVICLANQTFDGDELSQRRNDFEGRLRAIDQANSMLGDESAWWASELGTLIVRAFQGKTSPDHFTIDGPEVWLAPRLTMALNMTLHELITNAMKYGALSQENGHVDVVWTIDETNGEIEIHWRESGGPAIEAPGKPGFGSRLIEQLLPSEGGAVTLHFEPGGVHCVLRFKNSGDTDAALNE